MKLASRRRRIALPGGGAVSAVVALPPGFRRPGRTPAVILAHGAGSNMTNPFLSSVHAGLAREGLIAVKFNFPYTEARRRAPDPRPVLQRCYRAVVDAVLGDRRLAPPWVAIGGKSLGGRIASYVAADGAPVRGLLFLGYPLHPAGRPEQLRADHLPGVALPMLFVQGTRDALCDLERLRPVLARLPPATRGTNGRRRLGGDRRGGGALARRAGRVAGADSLLCARRERGAHEASVVRAQPGDGRRLALGDEAEDLAGLEVVVEAVEDVGDRARGARVLGVAGEERGELLLVRQRRGAEALEGGGAHGLGERGTRRGAHLAEALGEELGVSGHTLRDDAQPAAQAIECADGDPRRQHLRRGRLGGAQVVEEADHPLALGLGLGTAHRPHAPSRSSASRMPRSQRTVTRSSSTMVSSSARVSASHSARRTSSPSGASSGAGRRPRRSASFE